MSTPILSICIPTMNRAEKLRDTLRSIVPQLTAETELVILDGGQDATETVVREVSRETSVRVRYFREKEVLPILSVVPSNAGFDRACNASVELATGEYCWIFPDDDRMAQGAVNRVLTAMGKKYSLIIANAEVRSPDLDRVLDKRILPFDEDRSYTPAEWGAFIKDVGRYFTFMGCVIIQRSEWISRERESFYGSGFIHAAVIFQRPMAGPTFVISEPLIAIRYGDAFYMRSARYFEIWMFAWPRLVWSFQQYPDSVKESLAHRFPWRRWKTLLWFRAVGAYSIAEYDLFLAGQDTSRREKMIGRMIARIPGIVANLIALGYYHVTRRLPAQFHLDLVESPFYWRKRSISSPYARQH